MIIGLPVEADSMKANVSKHFGRSNYFLIYDIENKIAKFVENTAANSSGGAGVKAAQIIVDNNVEILISPQLGQNAADVINSENIKLYQTIEGSIEENIKAFKEKKLSSLNDIHEGYHKDGK